MVKYLFLILILLPSKAFSGAVDLNPALTIGVGYASTKSAPKSIHYGEGVVQAYMFQSHDPDPYSSERLGPISFNLLGVGASFSSRNVDVLLSPVSIMWVRKIGVTYSYHTSRKTWGYGFIFQF